MSAQYQHTEFGYNYRMTDISAAIGREQLKKLPNFSFRRREIAEMKIIIMVGIVASITLLQTRTE